MAAKWKKMLRLKNAGLALYRKWETLKEDIRDCASEISNLADLNEVLKATTVFEFEGRPIWEWTSGAPRDSALKTTLKSVAKYGAAVAAGAAIGAVGASLYQKKDEADVDLKESLKLYTEATEKLKTQLQDNKAACNKIIQEHQEIVKQECDMHTLMRLEEQKQRLTAILAEKEEDCKKILEGQREEANAVLSARLAEQEKLHAKILERKISDQIRKHREERTQTEKARSKEFREKMQKLQDEQKKQLAAQRQELQQELEKIATSKTEALEEARSRNEALLREGQELEQQFSEGGGQYRDLLGMFQTFQQHTQVEHRRLQEEHERIIATYDATLLQERSQCEQTIERGNLQLDNTTEELRQCQDRIRELIAEGDELLLSKKQLQDENRDLTAHNAQGNRELQELESKLQENNVLAQQTRLAVNALTEKVQSLERTGTVKEEQLQQLKEALGNCQERTRQLAKTCEENADRPGNKRIRTS